VVGRGFVIASVEWGKSAPAFELGRFLFNVMFFLTGWIGKRIADFQLNRY
jgi:hypothetical protein